MVSFPRNIISHFSSLGLSPQYVYTCCFAYCFPLRIAIKLSVYYFNIPFFAFLGYMDYSEIKIMYVWRMQICSRYVQNELKWTVITVLPYLITIFSALMCSLKFICGFRRRKSSSVNGISGSSCIKQKRRCCPMSTITTLWSQVPAYQLTVKMWPMATAMNICYVNYFRLVSATERFWKVHDEHSQCRLVRRAN